MPIPPLRVATSDITTTDVLNKLKSDLSELRNSIQDSVENLNTLRVVNNDELITNLTDTTPQPIQAEPLPPPRPVDVYSEPGGAGTKYRSEADPTQIINSSLVCYLFDEWQIAGRNAVTAAGSLENINPPITDPNSPKWEKAAVKEEADKTDHNIRKVRNIFDQPFPNPPETITVPVPTPQPYSPLVFIDPSSSYLPNSTVLKLNTVSPINLNDAIQIAPDIKTQYIVTNINAGTNEITINPPLKLPAPPLTPITKISYINAQIPMPLTETFLAESNPLPILNDLSSAIIEDIIIPVTTPLTQLVDKSTNNFNATIIGPPPPPATSQGPFGEGKGRTFLPEMSAYVQIEPLLQGTPPKTQLRQGTEAALAAIFRPDPLAFATGCTLASCSSPPVGGNNSPFPATLYSLQLVKAPTPTGPALFPRLTWQFYSLSSGGILRAAYAQSFTPIPMPFNNQTGEKASNINPLSTNYFIGVARYKKELNMASDPFYPAPGANNVALLPNFDNPKASFNTVKFGDWVSFGIDPPNLGISSYQITGPGALPGAPAIGPAFLDIPYVGNPPKIEPFPSGKKLYSLGVSFYIGDLNTGQFFVDDFVAYGVDEMPSATGLPFITGINRNLPFPATGELSNLFIGRDANGTSYIPSSGLNGGLIAADLAYTAGSDLYSVIGAGHYGSGFPVPAPPLQNNTFSGDFYLFNIPGSVPHDKSKRDKLMTDYFNSCFSDYKIENKTIRRTGRSQIPNGGDVYLNYYSTKTLQGIEDDSNILKATIDAILASSNNPNTNSVDKVADAVGVPGEFPMIIVEGQPYLPGTTKVDGFKTLSDLVGYDEAKNICDGPARPVLVTSINQTSTSEQIDSCGNSFTKLTVTEKILGINISTQRALFLAGVADPGLLILRLFWVGGLQAPTVGIQEILNSFGLFPEDRAAALLGTSNGTLEVYDIPEKNICNLLPGTPGMIKKLFTEFSPKTLNLNPSSRQLRDAISTVARLAPPQTSDNIPGPVAPVVQLFRQVDLSRTFNFTQEEIQKSSEMAAQTMSEICSKIFDGLGDCVKHVGGCVTAVQASLAPILDIVSFNIGMMELSQNVYIPCLGNFTPSMSVPDPRTLLLRSGPLEAVLKNYPNIVLPVDNLPQLDIQLPAPPQVHMPTPRELLDRLNSATPELKSLAAKIANSKEPMKAMQGGIAALGIAVGSLIGQVQRSICIPRTLIEALRGGGCALAIPPDIMESCVNNNPDLQEFITRAEDFLVTAEGLLTQVSRIIPNLQNMLNSSVTKNTEFLTEIEDCLIQVASFVQGLAASPVGLASSLANNPLFYE